jgi:hypothetical protein
MLQQAIMADEIHTSRVCCSIRGVRSVAQWLIVFSIILASATAEAQQQKALTLSCKGTTIFPRGSPVENAKPEDVSMGIIFNFATGEVSGFDGFALGLGIYYHAKIAAINDTTVYFKGGSSEAFGDILDGTINRVTGELDATTTSLDKNQQETSTTRYILHCTPTQRMF